MIYGLIVKFYNVQFLTSVYNSHIKSVSLIELENDTFCVSYPFH
jgi:hypothetical protein